MRCNSSRSPTPAASPLCDRGKLLPALFVIGSLKTGTTSLWSHLIDDASGHVLPGSLTDKGDVSRKEKDYFGDPTMYRRGPNWYRKIWPTCASAGSSSDLRVAIDATPAYHVFHDAPQNMATFFGPPLLPRLRLVWMLRDPVSKFWSYFWELKMYGGDWDKVQFSTWTAPKIARTKECLQASGGKSPLWPPSMPPPYKGCAPHLDHGLYEPQLRRWLEFFDPSQLLLVSFSGYARKPAAVVRDVLVHAGTPLQVASEAADRVRKARKPKNQNSRSTGRGRLPMKWRAELHALYDPFTERFYSLVEKHRIPISPCEQQGSRFLDDPEWQQQANASSSGSSSSGGGRRQAKRAGLGMLDDARL